MNIHMISGGVCAAKGFRAAGVAAGIKYKDRKDVALIVSEETGNISYSYKGRLWSNVTPEQLRGALVRLQNKLSEEEARNNLSHRTLGEIGKNAFKKKKPGPSEKDDKEKDSKGKEGGAHG